MESDTRELARYDKLLVWLRETRGVRIAEGKMGVARFEGEEGWGMAALEEMEKGTTLFSIPRPPATNSPLLALHSSRLIPSLDPHHRALIANNWIPLLLVLLFERVQALLRPHDPLSWAPYFDTLPQEFDTLMFWNQDELAELTGSTILEKIGKEEAEKDYERVVKRVIESRADLFPVPEGTSWEENYGLAAYHRMGSLVLSRSFHVEAEPQKNSHQSPDPQHDVSMDSAPPSIDNPASSDPAHDQSLDQISLPDSQDHDDLEREAVQDIAMVPLADLLNAKTGCENAKLFYESDCLKMKATRNIKKGEQIYNTYGDPPNADLLRRYGHVDNPNRFDVVEISIKTCLEVAKTHLSSQSPDVASSHQLEERLEWALEMGLDDVFEIPTELERKKQGMPLLPDDLTCILQILLLTGDEFGRHKAKEKLPKPKLHQPEVMALAQKVINRRMADYPTTIDEDQRELEAFGSASHPQSSVKIKRKIKALMVRKSEKEILASLARSLAQKQHLLLHPDSQKRKSTHDGSHPSRPKKKSS